MSYSQFYTCSCLSSKETMAFFMYKIDLKSQIFIYKIWNKLGI